MLFRSLALFAETISLVKSIEDLGGMPDASLEKRICQVFEALHQKHVDKIVLLIRTAVRSWTSNHGPGPARKGSGFGPVRPSAGNICRTVLTLYVSKNSTRILEAAFSRSPALSQRECALVAEAAGVSHQQVRVSLSHLYRGIR